MVEAWISAAPSAGSIGADSPRDAFGDKAAISMRMPATHSSMIGQSSFSATSTISCSLRSPMKRSAFIFSLLNRRARRSFARASRPSTIAVGVARMALSR